MPLSKVKSNSISVATNASVTQINTTQLNINSNTWSNLTGGSIVIVDTGRVGPAITWRPQNANAQANIAYANGWSIYAGAMDASIGEGSFGFWNHRTNTAPFFVDTNGYNIRKNQVAFMAYHDAGDVNYTVGNLIPYQSVMFNEGNGWNTSTSTFTAPVAGRYMFSATINAHYTTGLSGTPRAYWQVNGSNIGNAVHFRGTESSALENQLVQRSATVILNLAKTDTVRIYVNQNRFDLFGANHMCGYLLG